MADVEIGELKTTLEANAEGFVTQLKKAAQVLYEVETQSDKTGEAVDKAGTNATKGANKIGNSFNGLNYQIQMFARELPTLAMSPQMFILAISNNLPMLADEISNVAAKNKELADSGEPVVSTFSQLLKGTMNWQTLLVVGITVLTMYSDEITDWVGSLFKSGDAISYAADAQKEFNSALSQGVRDAQGEVVRLNLLRRAAESENLSRTERLEAVKALKSEFPQYLKNLSNEAILQGKVANAYKDTATAIVAKAQAVSIEKQITENAIKMYDFDKAVESDSLQTLISKYQDIAIARDKFIKQYGTGAIARGAEAKIDLGSEIITGGLVDIDLKLIKPQKELKNALNDLKKNLKKDIGKDDEKIDWINEIFAPFDDNSLPFDKQLAKFLSYSDELSKVNEEAAKEIIGLMGLYQEGNTTPTGDETPTDTSFAKQIENNTKALKVLEAQKAEFGETNAYLEKHISLLKERASLISDPIEKGIIEKQISDMTFEPIKVDVDFSEFDEVTPMPKYDSLDYYAEAIERVTKQIGGLIGAERDAAIAQKQRLEMQQALAGGDYTGGLNLQSASLGELQTLWSLADESSKEYLATLLKIGEGGQVEGLKKQIGDLGAIATSGINSFANELGSALSDGAISKEELTSMFVTPVAQMAQQLGSLLIAAGIAEKALFSGNPAAMITAGIALVAIGSALSAAVSNMKNSSTENSSAGGTIDTFTGGYSNGAPSDIWDNTKSLAISGDFRLDGNDLVASFNNTNKYNSR